MIVTVQIVFCYLKEAFESLLFKYREGHSVDQVEGNHTERSEQLITAGSEDDLKHVQSSTCQSENTKNCEFVSHLANPQGNTPFSLSDMISEEDWDNDIVNYVQDNNTRLQTNTVDPSSSEANLKEKNSFLGVTGKKDLLCEESSSTYSSDTEPWVESSSQDHQTSYPRSLHLVSERDWLDELESLYFSDMITELKLLLPRAFEASKNCFDFVLYVIKFADFDIQAGKKSIAYLTLVEFEAWLKSKTEGISVQEAERLGFWPSDNHKDLALEVVVSSTFLLFEPIKRTFQLDSGENGFLTKHVRFLMHSKRKYKEAATIAYKLKLQKHFEVTEILLPLIITDKLQLAESYVAGCPSSLQLFMKMIDDLCAMTDDELQLVVEKAVSPVPKDHRLKNKILVKLGERLVKMFNLKAENFPNIYKEKNLNGLRYLLQKKYSEKQPLNQKWDNLIETSFGDNKWLHYKLIESLVEFDDIEEAARWTMFYCLPLESVHPLVKQLIDSWQASNEDSANEDWEAEMDGKSEPRVFNNGLFGPSSTFTKFHSLPLPLDRIFVVDNAQSFRECTRALCVSGNVVGFDTEWRPTMCRAGTDERLAIIQLSTWNEVYILDMMSLTDNVKDSEMKHFAESFFANPQVLKLGYGVDSDFRNLVSSCPIYEHAVKHLARFVDICPLSKQILNIPSVRQKVGARMRSVSARERACIEEERGLSELVFLCLGLPLDKTYQISDWERRPLSEEQLVYAALDAYCLLEVYDVLNQWVVESKLRINMEPEVTVTWLQPKKEKRRSRQKHPKPGTCSSDLLPPARKREPIPPQSLRVVVDTMLQGLGQHLRCCGVDVAILDNTGDHARAAEIAINENRIILTTGLPYEQLRSLVPEGMCVCVPCMKIRQQVLALKKYFNVKVRRQDIFSRCQVCNGTDFVHVHQDHMRMVMGIFHGRFQAPLPGYEPEHCPVNLMNLTLPGGVPLKLGPLPEEVADSADVFFCCSSCGKVFWEGGHHKRIATQFSYLLDSPSHFH